MVEKDIEVLQTDFKCILADEGLLIARFFDAEKVNRLIEEPGIWFSRFDKMSDEREGEYYELMAPEHSGYTAVQMGLVQSNGRFNHIPLISCWTLFDSGEEKKMWDTYAPEPGSICCVTTVKRLWQSLDLKLEFASKSGDSEGAAQEKPDQGFIPCGLVRYYSPKFLNSRDDASRLIRPVFYRPGDMEDRSYHSTEFVKRDCFSFEKEARFICFGDGRQMIESEETGRLAKFKDLRLQAPFLRIIARPDIAPSVYSELQDLFGCSLTISEVSGPGRSR